MSRSEKLAVAIEFAFNAHRNQFRKGEPENYIMHPLRVMTSLIDEGVLDYAVLAAAVLHDTIEDTPTTIGEIRCKFGKKVARFITYLTDDPNLTRNERKEASRTKMETAPIEAKLIKSADRLDNVMSMYYAGWTDEKKKRYIAETRQLIQALIKNLDESRFCDIILRNIKKIQSVIGIFEKFQED